MTNVSNLDTSVKGASMISTKRAMTIIFEQDREKRDIAVDKLKEEDAKYMLKLALAVIRRETNLEEK